jgi:hypothetical protein
MNYNGHKNYNHWNVSLWLNNDEGLYRLMREATRGLNRDAAARQVLAELEQAGTTHTPDGAKYSVSTIRAAMVGL